MCKNKFKQNFLLKKHVKNKACTKQDFSSWYCDQCFTDHKSISKRIRHNRCRNVNNYRFTKDKTVLACESGIDDKFDTYILTYNHAQVKIRRVNDTNIATIMNGVGEQDTTHGNKLKTFPCTHCGRLYRNWESLF